jgi:hypothetical protein
VGLHGVGVSLADAISTNEMEAMNNFVIFARLENARDGSVFRALNELIAAAIAYEYSSEP